MEKKIKLTINQKKDIDVSLNGESKLTIESNNRNIEANAIYDLLDYSINDTYSIETLNESKVDGPVLDFFADLIKSIVNKIDHHD